MNYGKEFENKIKETLLQVTQISVDRFYDPTNGFMGVQNICDFGVFQYPHQFYLECKSIQGGTWNFKYLTLGQYTGLLEKSLIEGVLAGVVLWFVDHAVTIFIDVEEIKRLKELDVKSISVKDLTSVKHIDLQGRKLKVYCKYEGSRFISLLHGAAYKKWGR